MNKRVLLIVFLILISLGVGYLFLDKFYLHFIFKIKPGSCLILEEKFCKTGKLYYDNNNNLKGIVYTVDSMSKLFSPKNSYFNLTENKTDNKNLNFITIGKTSFSNETDREKTDTWYQLIFSGDISEKFNKSNMEIGVGSIIATIKNKSEVYLLINKLYQDNSGNTTLNTDEGEINNLINKNK